MQHLCEDYKEFTQLCLVYLDNGTSRAVNFRWPDAFHKARLMVNNFYFIKMVFLEKRISLLHKGATTAPAQQQKLCSFVNFIQYMVNDMQNCCCCAMACIICPYQNRLRLKKYIMIFPAVRSTEPSSVVPVYGYAWYLALFIDIVLKVELQYLVYRLSATRLPNDVTIQRGCFFTRFDKPNFPTKIKNTSIVLMTSSEPILGSFLNYYIWTLQFLRETLTIGLVDYSGHQKQTRFAVALNVVNDSVKRGVKKLSSDYLYSARSEKNQHCRLWSPTGNRRLVYGKGNVRKMVINNEP